MPESPCAPDPEREEGAGAKAKGGNGAAAVGAVACNGSADGSNGLLVGAAADGMPLRLRALLPLLLLLSCCELPAANERGNPGWVCASMALSAASECMPKLCV